MLDPLKTAVAKILVNRGDQIDRKEMNALIEVMESSPAFIESVEDSFLSGDEEGEREARQEWADTYGDAPDYPHPGCNRNV